MSFLRVLLSDRFRIAKIVFLATLLAVMAVKYTTVWTKVTQKRELCQASHESCEGKTFPFAVERVQGVLSNGDIALVSMKHPIAITGVNFDVASLGISTGDTISFSGTWDESTTSFRTTEITIHKLCWAKRLLGVLTLFFFVFMTTKALKVKNWRLYING